MNKKFNKKLKVKAKSFVAHGESNSSPRNAHLEANLSESQRRPEVRSFASAAKLTTDLAIHTTPTSVVAMTKRVSPSAQLQASPPLVERSPTRSLGARTRAWLMCWPYSRPS